MVPGPEFSDRMGVEEHRDWSNVDYSNLLNGQAFPPDFMWGCSDRITSNRGRE